MITVIYSLSRSGFITSFFFCFRMISYSWRVSWFWPQLNLCAWTRLFLLRAQPIVSSTTGRKWTLAPWNGTRVKLLISCVKTKNTVSLFWTEDFKRENGKWSTVTLKAYSLVSFVQQLFQKVFKSCTEPAAGTVPSAYATAVTTVRLPAEEEGEETHSCCRPEDLKDGKCKWCT